jgi:hypothetical protein
MSSTIFMLVVFLALLLSINFILKIIMYFKYRIPDPKTITLIISCFKEINFIRKKTSFKLLRFRFKDIQKNNLYDFTKKITFSLFLLKNKVELNYGYTKSILKK